MKKVNITTLALSLYLIVMSVIGWPGNDPNRSFTNYFLVIGVTLVVIILLRFLQIKRMKMRNKWKDENDQSK
ncbi:hypothetical protein [Parabacteroides sp. PF5-9]|uniref:hypothetical protein n=1 Tax=Parabacteroides sp. PF5-9 TaxID=1742404 RepID=UPI0024750FB3|nr:hypothetical protein [Parabacteroides sp. PF5-9]MDH6356922.1 hypothetical protein [Parabacteroides sp. PF5-9]